MRKNDRSILDVAGMLFAALCGLAFALALVSCGCSPAVEMKGEQKIDVYHHYDTQKVDVDIHRNRRRPPK